MTATDREPSAEARHRVMVALERHDTGTREVRADRIIWHSRFDLPGAVMFDRHESAMLLEQARKCFTGGQFVATLILAAAYAEQTTSELLDAHGVTVPWDAHRLFKVAGERTILPMQLASRADQLRHLRNALVHRVPDDEKHDNLREERDPFTIGRRMAQLKRHPKVILEADAKEALEVMYAIFQRDLASSGPLRDEDHDEED